MSKFAPEHSGARDTLSGDKLAEIVNKVINKRFEFHSYIPITRSQLVNDLTRVCKEWGDIIERRKDSLLDEADARHEQDQNELQLLRQQVEAWERRAEGMKVGNEKYQIQLQKAEADSERLDELERLVFTNREGERELHIDFTLPTLREAIDARKK